MVDSFPLVLDAHIINTSVLKKIFKIDPAIFFQDPMRKKILY